MTAGHDDGEMLTNPPQPLSAQPGFFLGYHETDPRVTLTVCPHRLG